MKESLMRENFVSQSKLINKKQKSNKNLANRQLEKNQVN